MLPICSFSMLLALLVFALPDTLPNSRQQRIKQLRGECLRVAACCRTLRIALFVSPAAPKLHQLDVELVKHRPIQRADGVDQLETKMHLLAQNLDPGL